MNIEETKKAIEVMQAYVDGKAVQAKSRMRERFWYDWPQHVAPNWDWEDMEYRIKPEPREFWVLINKNGEAAGVSSHGYYIKHDQRADTAGAYAIKVREVIE